MLTRCIYSTLQRNIPFAIHLFISPFSFFSWKTSTFLLSKRLQTFRRIQISKLVLLNFKSQINCNWVCAISKTCFKGGTIKRTTCSYFIFSLQAVQSVHAFHRDPLFEIISMANIRLNFIWAPCIRSIEIISMIRSQQKSSKRDWDSLSKTFIPDVSTQPTKHCSSEN